MPNGMGLRRNMKQVASGKMKIYVGVTDIDWFNFWAKEQPEEENFWLPGSKQAFRALGSNDQFDHRAGHALRRG
jgi:putative restriction endonuclease